MSEESKPAVLSAMGANFAIAIGKLVAGLITGSASLLAEAGHSVADTVNQVFLLLGINLSDTEADEKHPHGYGKEAFFWSFLAAIFIFVAGATFSFYEGIRTVVQEQYHHRSKFDLAIGFGVLGGALLFELLSFTLAIRALRKGARAKGWSVVRFIRQSPDLTVKTVFWEDSAAIVGLILAASGLFLSEALHNEIWDGIASLAIGFLLAGVAFMLGVQSRQLLLGAAAGDEAQEAIRASLDTFPEVERVIRLLTMQMGSHSILVTGELQVSRRLSAPEIEDLIERLDARIEADVPDVADTFWELHREAPAAAPTA